LEKKTMPGFLRSRFFIAGCIFVVTGALCALWAYRLMQSMYAYRSPLHSAPPIAQEPLGNALSQRLVIVLVDGLREDTSRDAVLMPELAALRESGAWAVMHSRPPSFSQPGYSTLFVGAWPDLNDGPALNLDYDKIPVWTQDNLFTAVHRAGGRTAVAGSDTFERLIPAPDLNDTFFTAEANAAGDDLVMAQALAWLKAGGQSLVLIHLSQVDDAGDYLGGPRSAAWKEAAGRVDGMIGEIVGDLDLTKDTVMVVSDHGHLDTTGHGGPEAINLVEPFVMAGAGVWPGFFGSMEMVDVAPTAATLLGVSVPAASQGHVLTWMMTLGWDVSNKLPAAVEIQQKNLYDAYTRMIGVSATLFDNPDPVLRYEDGIDRARQNRLIGEIMGRSFLMLLPLAGAVYAIWRYRGRKLLERILLFAVFAAVFSVVYLFAFQQSFSLSRVTTEAGLMLAILVSTLAGFLAAWGLQAYLRGFLGEGVKSIAGNTLALAGVFMALAGLAVAANYVVNGLVVTWTLPEMNTGFFGFLGMLMITALAVVGGLIAGGAGLVQWARDAREMRESGESFTPAPAKRAAAPRSGPARKRTGRGSGKKR
jgi:hypothetical protein